MHMHLTLCNSIEQCICSTLQIVYAMKSHHTHHHTGGWKQLSLEEGDRNR